MVSDKPNTLTPAKKRSASVIPKAQEVEGLSVWLCSVNNKHCWVWLTSWLSPRWLSLARHSLFLTTTTPWSILIMRAYPKPSNQGLSRKKAPAYLLRNFARISSKYWAVVLATPSPIDVCQATVCDSERRLIVQSGRIRSIQAPKEKFVHFSAAFRWARLWKQWLLERNSWNDASQNRRYREYYGLL